MKSVACVIGLVVGVTGCSGSIGGDLRGNAGSGSASSSSSGGAGTGPGSAGVGGDVAGTAGHDSGTGGVNTAGSSAGGSGPPSGGGGGFSNGGVVIDGGNGGSPPTGYEPQPSCNSAVDAWIAFDSDAANFNRDLYVVRPDGSQLTRLTTEASIEKEPAFSVSGDRLSFTSNRDGSWQIYVLDLVTFTVSQLTHRAEGADHSSFSPDGHLLAFHSGKGVYTIEPNGSNEALIASDPATYDNPRFIGNTQLAFDRDNEIDAIKLDQTNARNIIANDTALSFEPVSSPQGNEIAYSAGCYFEPGRSLWTAASTASSRACNGRRLTPAEDTLDDTHASWGPASTFAYQRVDRGTNIGRITLLNRAAGSLACSLTPATQDSRNPCWSAEGVQISFPTAP